MLEKIINKTLPIYPWSDPRLIKLPGTNSLGQEPLFLMCDRFKEQMALRDYLVKAKAEKVCLANLETEDILHECLDFIIACVRKNPKYQVYEIKEHKKLGDILNVTVDFIGEVITCIRDKDKKIVSGDPERIKKIYDTWIFSRDTKSKNPNWQLVETLN